MLATKKSAWLLASSLFMGCVFLPNTVNASLKLAPLGEVPIPADNKQTPEKIELGKILFFDGRLSGDTTSPCSGCHIQSQGWGFPDDLSMGYPGTVHWRNSQTIINSAYYNKLFWAGSAMSLEAQAKDAAKGAVAGNGEDDIMEARLALVPEYVERFKQVFGDDTPKIHNAWRAISAFERTMVQRDTPIDNYLLGDETALSESQLKGKALFEGKANCIACHNGSLASDQKFYNIGVPPSPWWNDDGLAQITFRFELYSKGVTEEMYRTLKADPGAYFRAKRKEMLGKFRTPSLRYTKYTAPYMHNGTIPTLEAVIDFYGRGGVADDGRTTGFPQTKSVLIQPLGLTEQDKKNLLSFVEAFSGEQISIDEPKIPEYQPLFTKEELAGVKK
ncbi:cytochrome-c peroxidase [Vibrio echinoideorum]|uniref:cytochrome-c peroxidase n=1 Tax=Vibrio echinoideorum TaxID=2100116 RepID=UPI001080B586|nr:cytochrome c peroxidase [Vibrio echinoideorum]